jgi:uncharacterized protein (DUF488 family)
VDTKTFEKWENRILRVFTIGHSTRTLDELISLLNMHSIGLLVDVRSFPRSFANPQFNQQAVEVELPKRGIRYVWLGKLGGRRKGLGKESKNTCWKNRSFRNYADYMETAEFEDGINDLLKLANEHTAAIMCAEALHWRCHRTMIADFLKSKEVQVTHIFSEREIREHEYSQCAKIRDGVLTYQT